MTFFAVEVAAESGHWRVMRRYNDFHELKEGRRPCGQQTNPHTMQRARGRETCDVQSEACRKRALFAHICLKQYPSLSGCS